MAATASSYEKLLSPGRIGPVTTRNRILKTGAGMLMWHESDTHMRPEMLAFYERMARGGTGLIIVESPTIDYPAGARWRMRYRIDDDRFIEGLKELVDVIHKHGCPTFMQMNHDGPWQADLRHIEPDQVFAGPPLGASPVSVPYEADFHNEVPKELIDPRDRGPGGQVRRRGRARQEGRLRRRRRQRRQQPPAAQLPLALLEPARGHLRR